ncbi:MAG: radical SAM protein [Planctomycetes bacterium]|jgi:oxygen-independent coproporphyrinogen-3 oxidase|nr:radical SAM protein [Planctomycetota bacterium]
MSDEALTLPQLEQDEATTAGNFFVSNYPPFSQWSAEHVPAVHERLAQPGDPSRPLGLYVHIPFCRKRCHFCYFKVYTDKNKDEIRDYLDAVIAEISAVAKTPYINGRQLDFIYFGGGTPSYLSDKQLTYLFEGLQHALPWDAAREVAFECEPGTLNAKKVPRLRELGVTRLSLGIENFNDDILELNNRAHRSKQVYAAYEWVKDAGFPQVNIDLIAGMLGETEANWQRNIDTTLELEPDAVTIYQMEVPYNTTIYKQMKEEGQAEAPVADWATKRRWVTQAYEALEAQGYEVGSAYTATKPTPRGEKVQFVYRDALWGGADMLAVGVSSFGHLGAPMQDSPATTSPRLDAPGGVHFQNHSDIVAYVSAALGETRPAAAVSRALPITREEALIRQWVLQLKLGRVSRKPFIEKFGVDPFERWAGILREYEQRGYLRIEGDELILDRQSLLQVDRLLHAFFLPKHRDVRYA